MRNPSHELRARELIRAQSPKPVTCAHELSSKLDAPRRALTAALNARLTPQIRHLIEALAGVLGELGIDAPLMIVKGDGSLMRAEVALGVPVETILSGPAASVVGAGFFTGLEDFVVSDMGGTTTDIAVVSGGRPVIRAEGALVGGWRTMVEAVDVRTSGLGGDSEVGFDRQMRLTVGPRKAMPLSLLAHRFPAMLAQLRSIAELERLPDYPTRVRIPQSRSHAAAASVGARAPALGCARARALPGCHDRAQRLGARCIAAARRCGARDACGIYAERCDARARTAAGLVPRGGAAARASSRPGAQRAGIELGGHAAADLRAHA